MKYLCLVYLDEQSVEAMSAEETEACVRDSRAYDAALRQSGHMIAAHALKPVAMATTVRTRNGRVSTTDGPFAETKEQLGGFILIEARDLDDAIQVASSIPVGRLGCIEVRPVASLD